MVRRVPARSSRGEDPAQALSWFRREPDRPARPGAQEPLRRAFLLVSYLRASGIPVGTLQTTTPGRVVYEDRWQIVAVPGPETPRTMFPG